MLHQKLSESTNISTHFICFGLASHFVLKVPPTVKVIWRRGHSLVSSISGGAGDRILDPWVCSYALVNMGEDSKFPKTWTFETPILKHAVCPLNIHNSSLNGQLSLQRLEINKRSYYDLHNSAFWGWLSVESQPQNPEFRNNPETHTHWFIVINDSGSQ